MSKKSEEKDQQVFQFDKFIKDLDKRTHFIPRLYAVRYAHDYSGAVQDEGCNHEAWS